MTGYISLDYLAGFIDGEGYFTICKAGKQSKTFMFRLGINNTDLEIIQLIQKEYGGRIYEDKRAFRSGRRRCWMLIWSGNSAIEMSQLLKDKLIIKKQQAEIFSQIHINEIGKCHNIGYEENDFRKNSMTTIQNLNQRGRKEVN